MDKKILKKVLLVLSIFFIILTFAGAGYVLLHKGQVSAGYSAVPCFGKYCLQQPIIR